MGFLIFLAGIVFGIVAVIFLPRLIFKLFEVTKHEYEVKLRVMYYQHPLDTSKKGEYISTKTVSMKVVAYDEGSAEDFAREIVEDNLRIEIDSVELIREKV